MVGHILTIIEQELANSEPAMVSLIEQEIQLLVNKLESYIDVKSPMAAKVLTPVFTTGTAVADAMINAAGAAAVETAQA